MYLNKRYKKIFENLIFFEIVRLYKNYKNDLGSVYGDIMELEEIYFKLTSVSRKTYDNLLYKYGAIEK